ncbi:Hypothetical predicted protein [Paramuricea clavata]|uniref:Uncharacterized protein n=1 Tax=Paramuricea clavata TaxID=317549 RepID=A0A6S7FLR5_PARCT|nr:Hypothetical predicted protein [Paramuricea clavata]
MLLNEGIHVNMDDLPKKKRARGGHRSYVNKLMAGLREKIGGVFMETGNKQVIRELQQLKITLMKGKILWGKLTNIYSIYFVGTKTYLMRKSRQKPMMLGDSTLKC